MARAQEKIETLLEIEPTDQNARNTEGDIVELEDGRLCLVYSRFRDVGLDYSPADLAMRISADGGKTWTGDSILVSGAEAVAGNVMSVSIVRLPTGELLLFYLRLDSRSSEHLYLRRSSDEFATLSEPVRVGALEGYESVNNDRVVQLSSGRLIVPANMHSELDAAGRPDTCQHAPDANP